MSDAELARMEARRDISNEDWTVLMDEMKRRAERRPVPTAHPPTRPVRAVVAAAPPAPPVVKTRPQEVVITDIEMRFGSMVVFMVKWAIASIPALIILVFVAMLLVGVLFAWGTIGAVLRR